MSPKKSATAAGITCCWSRTTSRRCRRTSEPRCTTTRTFPPYQARQKAAAEQTAQTVDKGHGRWEHRRLTSTTLLNAYLDWPAVGQVFALERLRRANGKVEVEVVYGITSLGRGQADARRLLALVRDHWRIENGLHYVRDVTLGEDACRVRRGSAPQVLAAIRNVAVHLWQGVQAASKAAAARYFAARPAEAIPLLLT
jgi:predicted transposase YbfD/YdcC